MTDEKLYAQVYKAMLRKYVKEFKDREEGVRLYADQMVWWHRHNVALYMTDQRLTLKQRYQSLIAKNGIDNLVTLLRAKLTPPQNKQVMKIYFD